jgi:hypothetical protein
VSPDEWGVKMWVFGHFKALSCNYSEELRKIRKKKIVSAKFRTAWIPAKYTSHAIKLSC